MTETWDEAIQRGLERNRARGHGVTTLRQLWRSLPGSEDTAKRRLTRIRDRNSASEKSAVQISEALEMPRSELPPRRSWREEFDDRLEELEDQAVRNDDLLRVETVLREAIEFLAKGDAQAALHVLSDSHK